MVPKKAASQKPQRGRRDAIPTPSHIIGIGASAGGLSALEEFFDHMPVDSGMAFVIIQHLSPDFKSLMDDLLARHTSMEIHRVTDGTRLKPNAIYLIPPKSLMTISKNELYLTEVKKSSQQTELPIDVFFKSLADDKGKKAVGVILSGTGTDGSRGIKSIREAGGWVFVQSIDSAQFDGMPRSALATGCCHLMLPPKNIPEVIMKLTRANAGEQRTILNRYIESEPEGENQQVFAILKSHYNLDFSKYKPSTVGRRIQRRMDFHKIEDLDEYISLLANNVNEINALYHDLLIGVTEFFRDPKYFQLLENEVIPHIFQSRLPEEDIRIWCAGCATGEEAYSLGILLAERAEQLNHTGNITVFATDVHRNSLDQASQGRYHKQQLANVSQSRLHRFFESSGKDKYQVVQPLRKMIVFAPHNLINDPPFTRIDLVSCRNLLIYLEPEIQEKVLALFHFSLKVDGYLFLGSSEGLGKLSGEFNSLEAKAKIFQKLRDINIAISMNLDHATTRFSAPAIVPVSTRKTINLDRNLLKDYDALLQEFMPPGVLIDQDRRMLHNFGDVSFFQQPIQGRYENDILSMVKDSLKLPLNTALHRAEKARDQVITRGVAVEIDGKAIRYDLIVKYIGHQTHQDTHYFISLLPSKPVQQLAEASVPQRSLDVQFEDIPNHLQQRIAELELELQTAKESLQTTIEELQTANEELQTTNEELMASNEELQSTNEELHSVNEELYTVNAEFEDKNRELNELNQDHINLLNSLETGIVYVDTQLRIRKFNPAIEKIFKLLPQDLGRPIDHIAYHLSNQAQMLRDVRYVLNTGEPIVKEVQTDEGQWLSKRVMPFLDGNAKIQGVILAFNNITSLKEVEDKLKKHTEELENEVSKRTLSLQHAKSEADKANAAKSTFLANMSHEIRTPMSGVLMAAELLGEMELSPKQTDLVNTLQKGARSLNSILDEILDFSKVEAGKIDLLKEPFAIEDVVDDILNLFGASIDVKGLETVIQIAEDIPEIVFGDHLRLKQVLSNLISNAVKFTHEGTIAVKVNVDKRRARNCIVHFEIKDTGIGVSNPDQDIIFEPFAQGDPSLTRQYGGTGLGLPISKRLVELMGGRIWLEQNPKGTSFHFTVVFDLLETKKTLASKHQDLVPSSPEANPFACKILLAEDDRMNQKLISAMIHKIGCELTLVDNGQKAVETLAKQKFDMALLDISMPIMDGLTATDEIRKFEKDHINHDVPIIALTAHAMEEDVKKFIGRGMNHVLPKPLSIQALKDVINTHCAKKETDPSESEASYDA